MPNLIWFTHGEFKATAQSGVWGARTSPSAFPPSTDSTNPSRQVKRMFETAFKVLHMTDNTFQPIANFRE